MLAVSFHATTDEVRDRLVPINKRWNIETLLDALRAYPKLSNAERITFEYVMLKDVNDSDADARRLINLIKGLPAQINLIPFFHVLFWRGGAVIAELRCLHDAGSGLQIRNLPAEFLQSRSASLFCFFGCVLFLTTQCCQLLCQSAAQLFCFGISIVRPVSSVHRSKQRLQAVVVLLRNRVEFVVVAAGTLHRYAAECV